MHMTQSALPPEIVDTVGAVDGVAWVEGLRYTTSIVEAGDGRQLTTYVFGYDTETGHGGPQRLAAGRPPGPGEVLIDDVAADELGIAYSVETGMMSHTDADVFYAEGAGIASGLVSVPIRRMHTPVETAQLSDAEDEIRLLEAFARGLGPELDLAR